MTWTAARECTPGRRFACLDEPMSTQSSQTMSIASLQSAKEAEDRALRDQRHDRWFRNAMFGAGLEHPIPYRHSVSWVAPDLIAKFAGISSSRNKHFSSSNFSMHKMIIF